MKDAVWFLLITAIGIPIGGSIVSYVNSRLAHTTAREAALLGAQQRQRDAEISQIRDAVTDLVEAATAVQSFVWSVPKDIRMSNMLQQEEFDQHREHISRAVVAAQKLRMVARFLPSDGLRNSYVEVEKLVMKVVRGSEDPTAPDPWHEDVSKQPDTITRAVNATADEIKRLYETYPSELLSRLPRPAGWYGDPYQPWTTRYWDGAAWTQFTMPYASR